MLSAGEDSRICMKEVNDPIRCANFAFLFISEREKRFEVSMKPSKTHVPCVLSMSKIVPLRASPHTSSPTIICCSNFIVSSFLHFLMVCNRAAVVDLLEVVPQWARLDVEEVVQLACRVNVNAHGVRDDSGSNGVIGVGLFPLTAMINHSCRPNCTFVFFGEMLMQFSLMKDAKEFRR